MCNSGLNFLFKKTSQRRAEKEKGDAIKRLQEGRQAPTTKECRKNIIEKRSKKNTNRDGFRTSGGATSIRPSNIVHLATIEQKIQHNAFIKGLIHIKKVARKRQCLK